ncbi:MAG TPA: ATP synthase subunit I [Pyrinomonadaceae bacterium]|nr:ATP synthase subunit I [Pyrinomonadaceae bacterium]
MSDENQPRDPADQTIKPVSHGRILVLMAVIGMVGGVLGILLISMRFGVGVVVGTLIAFVNYYWLKYSLRKVFALAAETGDRPRLLGLRYFGRYLVLGGVVAIFYAADAVSMVGLILGIGVFGFAVVVEGLIRIFSASSNGREY